MTPLELFDALLRYGRHEFGCQKSLRLTGNPICSCGLDDLLAKLKGDPQ